MFCNLKVTKLGDYYKITSINLKTSSKVMAGILAKSNEFKLSNNLIRAKNKINDLALSNDFTYFFTLTFKPCYDRYNLDELMIYFRNHIRYMRKLKDVNIKYLVVPEQHKDGAWHFHGFFTEDISKFFYTNEHGYISIVNLDSLGHLNVQVIKDKIRCSSYVVKYVAKNLGDGIKKFNHSYYASTGLNTGEEIFDKLYDNEYFNNKFFDWHNNFCYRKVITKEEFEKISFLLQNL